MAPDPRATTLEYMHQHKLQELVETLIAELIFHKPADIKQFAVSYLECVQTSGSKPLLDEQDLGVMFGMYDQTHKGVVTAGQADNALRTVLGAAAGAGAAEPAQKLRQDEFVQYMSGVLRGGMPYCQQPPTVAPPAAAVSKG